MFNLQGKVWGNTAEIFSRNNVEVHRIEVVPGGFCSKHRHNSKFNAFFVESGELEISVWKGDYDLVDKTVLKDGGYTVVDPGEYHQFRTSVETVAYEIYWVTLIKDIERESVGGID
tara:strand:+ start:399 stop:746 length:348 start_codon:yes stop_codon:yes gene_type:complete